MPARKPPPPPDKHHEVQMGPGHTLKLWFNPKHGWRAKSYDQRYPGCTRQQEHRVYTTANRVVLPSLLDKPNNLHWLPDPDEPDKKALYIGQLGLAGGMPPSQAEGAEDPDQQARDLSDELVKCLQEGSNFTETVKKLKVLCKDKNWSVRLAATEGLSKALIKRSESVFAEILPILKGQWHDKEDGVRLTVAESFSRLLGDQRSHVQKDRIGIIQVLILLRKDSESDVREEVAKGGLSQVLRDSKDKDWESIVSGLPKLYQNKSKEFRKAALESFKMLAGYTNQSQEPVVNGLIDLCKDDDSGICQGAIAGLSNGLKGECSKQVWKIILNHLIRLCKDDDSGIREAAIAGLSNGLKVCSKAVCKGIVGDLVPLCMDHIGVGEVIPKTLKACSEERWETIVTIIKGLCMDNSSCNVRKAAVLVLSEALDRNEFAKAQGWEVIVDSLTPLCTNTDNDVILREEALEALSKALESSSKEVWRKIATILIGLCRDKHVKILITVAEGLSNALNREDQKVRPQIIQALILLSNDSNSQVCDAVAAGGLSDALKECSEQVRESIVDGLARPCQNKDGHDKVHLAAKKGLKMLKDEVAESLPSTSEEPDDAVYTAARALPNVVKEEEDQKDTVLQGLITIAANLGLSKAIAKSSEEGYQPIVNGLIGLCKDEDEKIRVAAVKGLSNALSGNCSQEIRNAAIKTLKDLCMDQWYWWFFMKPKDSSPLVRLAAAESLSKVLKKGSKASDVDITEILTSLSKDENEKVRVTAVEGLSNALEYSEKAAENVLETLKSLCVDQVYWWFFTKPKDSSLLVRVAAVKSLSEMLKKCSKTKNIVEILTSLKDDRDEDVKVRSAAEQGLSSTQFRWT